MSLHLCPILSSLYFFINSHPILYLFPLTCRYSNNEQENDSTNGQGFDFEWVVYADKLGNEEDTKDDDLLPDLLRLVEQDKRQIVPYQEIMEAVNLGQKKKENR